MKRIGSFVFGGLLIGLTAMTTGCSSWLKDVLKEPKVKLDRVDVGSMGLTKSTLMFVLKVENPNGMDLKVDEVNYKVFLQDKAFSAGKKAEAVTVPAKGSAEVALPLEVDHRELWSNLTQLFSSKDLNYRIEGDAKLAAFRIPFETKGKVDLRPKD